MRRYPVAAAALMAGLATAIFFSGSVSAATALGACPSAPSPAVPTIKPPMATRISLSPGSVVASAGCSVTVLAQLWDWKGNPLANQKATFSILDGPNKGTSLSATSAKNGTLWTVALTSRKPGTDVVQATFSDGLEIHRSNRTFVEWHTGPVAAALRSPAAIQISPNCFQPAIAEPRASDTLKTVTPKKATPAPAAETSSISVTGTDFNPFSDVLITFDAGPGGKPQNFATQTDAFGVFSASIKVTEPQEGAHLIRADDFRQREATAVYNIPCSQGNIALDPPIGPPGFVTRVIGRNFPPNSPITFLNWTKPNLASPLWPSKPLMTDGQGNFQFSVLIFYHDELGPRTIRAVVHDTVPNQGDAVIAADAPFFVTLGRAQPADLVLRR